MAKRRTTAKTKGTARKRSADSATKKVPKAKSRGKKLSKAASEMLDIAHLLTSRTRSVCGFGRQNGCHDTRDAEIRAEQW
jgi:hypothetical protein